MTIITRYVWECWLEHCAWSQWVPGVWRGWAGGVFILAPSDWLDHLLLVTMPSSRLLDMSSVMVVSSAHLRIVTQLCLDVKLFVYKEKSQSDGTLPCGAPVLSFEGWKVVVLNPRSPFPSRTSGSSGICRGWCWCPSVCWKSLIGLSWAEINEEIAGKGVRFLQLLQYMMKVDILTEKEPKHIDYIYLNWLQIHITLKISV